MQALSVTTDYARDTGDPKPYVRRIAEAGFSHVHWCHEWNTEYRYTTDEVAGLKQCLKDLALTLLDLHAPRGPQLDWASVDEAERAGGEQLVRNRLEMTAELGGDAVVMHIPDEPGCAPLRKSLDALEPVARNLGVRIALENGNFGAIEPVLAAYSPDYLGLCYDCGHGNLDGIGLDCLEGLRDRLIAVHLHDNDGRKDLHQIPFMGNINWERLMEIISRSAYKKPLSLEVSMANAGISDEEEFLARSFAAGERLQVLREEAGEA